MRLETLDLDSLGLDLVARTALFQAPSLGNEPFDAIYESADLRTGVTPLRTCRHGRRVALAAGGSNAAFSSLEVWLTEPMRGVGPIRVAS